MGTGTDGLTTSKENAYDYYFLAKPFREMIQKGELDEAVLDDKVRRILRLMFRTNMRSDRPLGRMNNPEHLEVARKIAGEGIVLLKNDRSFFPINPDKKMTIAVIGENATRAMTPGGGSSALKPKNEISPLQGLQKRFSKATILHSMGYAAGPSQYGRVVPSTIDADSLQKAAVKIAKKADIVLFFGGLNKNHGQDCEGGDREDMTLDFGQDELLQKLIKANKNIGVIMISGNAVEMPWLPKVKGLIQAWYLGSQAGPAIADVISGDVNPSGKLPFSFPVKLSDNAAHSFGELSYPGDGKTQYYKEDVLVGYRWHDTQNIKPLFAFGYGMSYTSFKLSSIMADKKGYVGGESINISCKVSNTGKAAGSEVVQVYVGKPNSKVTRALKELKAFQKVHLARGKNAAVELSIDVDDLAFYDESISDWNLEKGDYLIYVGTASNQITKTVKISIN